MDVSLQHKIKQYWAPIVLLVTGIIILILGISEEVLENAVDDNNTLKQTSRFLIGGVAFLLAAIINFLYVANKISNTISIALTFVLLIGSGSMIFFNYQSIAEPIEFRKQKEIRDAEVIQRMIDTRAAQMQYKEQFMRYTGSYDTLIDFIKNGQVTYVKGDSREIPERSLHPDEADSLGYDERDSTKFMTEREAVLLGYISRDTLSINVMEYLYTRPEAVEQRPKDLLLPFDPDSLRYIPFSKGKDGKPVEFFMAATVVPSGRQVAPTFMIKDMSPFDPFNEKDTLTLGSLTELSTSGSWGD